MKILKDIDGVKGVDVTEHATWVTLENGVTIELEIGLYPLGYTVYAGNPRFGGLGFDDWIDQGVTDSPDNFSRLVSVYSEYELSEENIHIEIMDSVQMIDHHTGELIYTIPVTDRYTVVYEYFDGALTYSRYYDFMGDHEELVSTDGAPADVSGAIEILNNEIDSIRRIYG